MSDYWPQALKRLQSAMEVEYRYGRITAMLDGRGRSLIDEVMEHTGTTQEQLAAKIGVRRSYLNQVRNGKRPMTVKLATKLCEVVV